MVSPLCGRKEQVLGALLLSTVYCQPEFEKFLYLNDGKRVTCLGECVFDGCKVSLHLG